MWEGLSSHLRLRALLRDLLLLPAALWPQALGSLLLRRGPLLGPLLMPVALWPQAWDVLHPLRHLLIPHRSRYGRAALWPHRPFRFPRRALRGWGCTLVLMSTLGARMWRRPPS